ncbi:putative L-lactate dehydrogenase [cytochrome] [Arthrobacter sp. Hiyo4]|nr:putative L-lactate dehydrogenase [cytochrome] [Arthrobacter sp. Hiyo4]
MQFKKPEFSKEARLKRASTIWDLRDMAKRRTPQAPFDYTDGAAEGEITLRRPARPSWTSSSGPASSATSPASTSAPTSWASLPGCPLASPPPDSPA